MNDYAEHPILCAAVLLVAIVSWVWAFRAIAVALEGLK